VTGGPVYVLDANVFVEAARRYYAFDLAPGFWQYLIDRAKEGRVMSIVQVRLEIERGKDDLAAWTKSSFSFAFVKTDEVDVIESYKEVVNWVHEQDQYSDAAKEDFDRSADGWLIAYAKAHSHVLVTHEVVAPDARRKVPIPNVCRHFNVVFTDTFKMLRSMGFQFS